MNDWTQWAALFFALQTVALVWVVVSKRVKLRLSMEIGLALIALGLAMASVSLYESGSADIARFMRLAFIGSGVFVIATPLMLERKRGPRRRTTDFTATRPYPRNGAH